MDIESNEKPCDSCAPGWITSGWLSSSYTWFFLIFSGLVIFATFWFSDYNNEWYDSLVKPLGLIPDYAFSIVWGVLYAGILIAIIMAAWPDNRPCVGTIATLYVIIMLLMLLWVITFNEFHQLVASSVLIVATLPFIIWLIWLIWPRSCDRRNWFVGYFPVLMFALLFGWLCVASYYAISFAVLN